MNKNNFYIFFGLWVALLPFTGIPGVWRNGLVSASGIFLILVALGPAILKKLNKSKVKRKSKTTTDSYMVSSDSGVMPVIPTKEAQNGKKDINNEDSTDE